MKSNNKKTIRLFCLIFICILSVGLYLFTKENSQNVYAENPSETSVGVTVSQGDSIEFTEIKNWENKTLVFEIKTDGTETQFQLRKHGGGGSGIIRTKPDRGDINTADQVSFQTQSGSPYWSTKASSVALEDGWYRWTVKLTDLMLNDISSSADYLKCLKGTNVQVRNLHFYDDIYADASSYGYLTTPITNWRSQVVQFDINLSDGIQRRFQVCKDSGSGISGIVTCTTTSLKYENPNYVSGDPQNPYWKTSENAPIALGNGWYRFILDLSTIKMNDGRTGTETFDRFKNLPEKSSEALPIEMKNFKIYYNPAEDADIVLTSKTRTNIPDITNWGMSTISFEVYQDSLDFGSDPQFIFGEKGTEKNITGYFGFRPDVAGLYVRTSASEGYWALTSTQPVETGNGWYKWTIDLKELGAEGNDRSATIGNIYNRGNYDVYIRNFNIESSYDPSLEEGTITLRSGARTNIPEVELWSLKTISFEVYEQTLDPNSDPQFIFGAKGTDTNVTGYFGRIKGDTKLYMENAHEGKYWLEAPIQPESLGDGWYKWTIDLGDIRATYGAYGSEIIGNIFNRGASDVYIKNFVIESAKDPSTWEGVTVLKSKERTNIPDIPSWNSTVISFEFFKNTLDVSTDPQFIFGAKDTDVNVSGYFGYKKGATDKLFLQNAYEGDYWLEAPIQPEFIEDGWYKVTIDLSNLKATGGASGAETIGNIFNRGNYDVYLRNFKIESVYDPMSEDSVIVLKHGEKNILPESIPYWQYSIISFDVYHGSLDTSKDPQFQLFEEGSDKNSSGFFGYKQMGATTALWVRNADKTGKYWVESSNQPEAIGKGWFRWTIDLSELGVGEYTVGSETLDKLYNRGAYDVYIKNFTVSTNPFVMVDKKAIITPYENGLTEKINARIVKGSGELEYSSSDESVVTVDNKGVITFVSTGTAEIRVTVKGDDSIKPATCVVSSLALKDYKLVNLDELTGGEKVIDFPVITDLNKPITSYTYEQVSEDNPSVVVRFLLNLSYIEQNRQAVTIWGAKENPLYDGGYGLWAACYKGAFVFDAFGNSGDGGIKVNGINTVALNSHNTLVQQMVVNTDYFVEAGAIDVAELIDGVQYTYFYLKVNGVLVWSVLDVAASEYRNNIIAFTADGASRAKAKAVQMVNVNLNIEGEVSGFETADGLKLPEIKAPIVTDPNKKFIGWMKEDGTIWDYDRDRVDGEMTLTAVITSEFHTVNFDINYDNLGIVDSNYVGYGMTTKQPIDNPVREGYRFKWWSVSENGDEFSFMTKINGDLTLYAVWVKVYKVSFVYDGSAYLTEYYDINTNIQDPGWGYRDNYEFGKWTDRGMFALNGIAQGRAPYYSLTENGERVDFDKNAIKVTEDIVIYICFKEVETVRKDDEDWSKDSAWDYVSLRDLDDSQFKTDEYYINKYDTSTAEYVPSVNNNTGSVIFRGDLKLGDKFKLVNMNIGVIGLRSSLNAYNSVNIWLRTKEVYLETKINGKSVHMAFESFENVPGLEKYLEYDKGVAYLKTKVYIPLEFGILAVTTPGFEDYDRMYLKLGDAYVFDVIVPKYGKSLEGASYRAGFVTDADTATKSALSIRGVYPDLTVQFLDENHNQIASPITVKKYSLITEPKYKLPEDGNKKFVGWYDEVTKLMWNFKNERITSDMILIPTYGYIVTLDPNEGGFSEKGLRDEQKYEPMSQNVGDGCLIKYPLDPVREEDDGYEYVFAGWMKEDGTVWDSKNDVVTEELTLYAKWEIHVVITFYVEDESYKWDSKTVKLGSIVGNPKYGDPDSYDAYDDDEHEFLGWFIKNEKGEFVEVNLRELVAEDNLKIYALFSEDDNTGGNTGGGDDNPTKPDVPKTGCNKGLGCKSSVVSFLPIIFLITLIFIALKIKTKKFNI